MHGGAVALLIDMATTLAVAPLSKAGFWHFGGVTRTLGLTCLKPVRGGTTVWIDCEVKGIGKRLGMYCMGWLMVNVERGLTRDSDDYLYGEG
jgi:acyl-coenzyme A thioesterase PaaI-like protein